MKEEPSPLKNMSDIIAGLNENEQRLLSSIVIRIEAEKGEILLKEGDISPGVFWVESGMIRQFYLKDGRDITEHFACENSGAFCIKSTVNHEPTKLMIEALEKSTLRIISYNGMIALSEKYPVFNTFLRRVLELTLILSQDKADSLRFETANDRYERFLREYPEAAKRASINHIASYLLMSPETLSRVRSGTLKYRGHK